MPTYFHCTGGREFTYEIEPFVGIFGLNDASAPSIVKFMKSEVNPQLIASGIEDADFLDSPLRMGHVSYASGTEKIAFDFLNNLSSRGAAPMLLKCVSNICLTQSFCLLSSRIDVHVM